MQYFNSHYLTIEFDEKVHCVIMYWKATTDAEQFKIGLNKGLELLINKNSTKWLAELTYMGGIHKEEQRWAYEDWFPKAISQGLKHMAIVTPENIITGSVVTNIMKRTDSQNLNIKYCSNFSQAYKWLKSQRDAF